jgi:histidine triad (HIT) family protein
VFCRIIRGEISSTKLYESHLFLAFPDLHPATPKHLLIVPKRHAENFTEWVSSSQDPSEARALHEFIQEVATREGLSTSGFRLITNQGIGGGQSVFHLHFHLLGGRTLGALV